jgi:hypothetical protein
VALLFLLDLELAACGLQQRELSEEKGRRAKGVGRSTRRQVVERRGELSLTQGSEAERMK